MEAVIAQGRVLTPDLGGTASTAAMGDAVAEVVAKPAGGAARVDGPRLANAFAPRLASG